MKNPRNAETLTEYLFDMMEKVADDPDYVPQALAASKLAAQVIGVQKIALGYACAPDTISPVKFLEDNAQEEQ